MTGKRFAFITLLLTAGLLSACAKSSSPGEPPSSKPAENPFNGNGTISGGGGNGLNGKMIEDYKKDIRNLPEFKRIIAPIFRKLGQNKPDVLLVYLNWAARTKRWYFVPVALPQLPKEKIDLAFQSDQIALHSEREIFIDAAAYQKLPELQRGTLLLHEMVMGARFLMKKAPKDQCEALSSSEDLDLCKDEAYLKIATAPTQNGSDGNDLNGVDHVDVRSMTSLLLEPHQDFSAVNVFALRRRLRFNFPWDSMFSRLTSTDLVAVLTRSSLAQDRFVSPPSDFDSDESLCLLAIKTFPQWGTSVYLSSLKTGAQDAEKASSVILSPTDDHFPFPAGGSKFEFYQLIRPEFSVSGSGFDAIGVFDPFGSTSIIDKVTLYPMVSTTPKVSYKIDLFVSRSQPAQLRGYRLIPVVANVKNSSGNSPGLFTEVEWVEVKGRKSMECRPVN